MKSLRELHEEEQREAAWLDAAKRFHQTMDRLDADRERALRQMERDWRMLQIVIVLAAMLTFTLLVFGPLLFK